MTTETETKDPLDAMVDDFMNETDGNRNTTTTEDTGTETQTGTATTQQQGEVQETTGQQSGTPAADPNARPTQQGTDNLTANESSPEIARKFGDMFYSDRRGNIFDATGQLVAPSGNPHKLFRKMWGYVEKAQVEAAGYQNRLKGYEEANAAARSAGLQPEEYAAGISLMTAFKKDPKAAVQFLLQQAVNRGTDVSDIIQGGTGVTEATLRASVKEILTEALAPFSPFIQQREREAQLAEVRQEAQQEYDGFIQSYPDAVPHQAHIAKVMEQYNKPMVESYYILKTWALQQGLDWKSPLGQQVEALKARQQNGDPNGGGNNHRLPDLNGRTDSGSAVASRNRVAGGGESWDSILNEVMEEVRPRAGMR